MVVKCTLGFGPRENPIRIICPDLSFASYGNVSSTKALTSWRGRSPRKLKKITESPSRTVASGVRPSSVITVGGTNSSPAMFGAVGRA